MGSHIERKLDQIIWLLSVITFLLGALLLAEVGGGNAFVLIFLFILFGVITSGLYAIFVDREWVKEGSWSDGRP